MKVYIAAKYGHRFELRELVDMLAIAGIESTAQWINNAEESKSKAEAAQMDIDDITRADALVFFAEPKGSKNTGGGRYFELGYAAAIGKPVFISLVDDHETVFTALRSFTIIPDETTNDFENVVNCLKERMIK